MKIFFVILFSIVSVFCSAQTTGYPGKQFIANNDSTLGITNAMQARAGFINASYVDTTAANQTRIRQYAGAEIYTTSDNKRWFRNLSTTAWIEYAVGPIETIDSLFGVQDNLASANRSFGLNSFNFTYTGQGNFIVGDANTILSSTAKLQVKGHPRTNIVAFGNQPVDGIPLSMFNVDTVTTANLSSQLGRWAQIDRRLNIQDNNLTISDKSGTIINLGVQGKDSTILNSQGGDLMYGLRGSMFLGKYPGFSGRTVFNSGSSVFDVVPAELSYMATSGGTSSVNNIRMRGFWGGHSSYINITNAGDTLDNWMGYITNGQNQGTIRKSYGFYAGGIQADSGWAVYSPTSTNRSYFEGNVSIGGGNTGPTNALEVAGQFKLVNGTQSNGYVLTSDANGLSSWQPTASGTNTLQQVLNAGAVADTGVTVAYSTSYTTYGTVWQDAFARSSFGSNYATTGAGVTYTFPSSAYLNISGTANSNNDYFTRVTDSTNENKGSITTRIIVNSKSASTFGIYIGWQGINAVSTNHPVFGGVTLTTGSNNLFFLAETTPFTYNDPQTLTIAAGDTIDLTISRVDWTYTLSYFNFTGDVARSVTYTGVPQGSVLPFTPNGFSLPAFHTLGADIRVYNFSRISDESKNARNVFGYNSLILGGNITDPSQRMGYIACGGNHANVIFAAGGGSVGSYLNATYDEDLARYAAGGAENFWCEVSGNDSAFSVWDNVGKPALIAARNRWVAAGKRWIWIQPSPRNALNLRAVADTVTAIAARYGDPLVPLFDRFNVSNQLPSDFNAGDGVHWTAYANRYIGYYIDSLYPQYTRQSNTTGVTQAYTLKAQNINFNSLQEFNYTAAAQTATLPPDVNYVRINPSSTLATLTIQLPTIVDSGHIYWISFGGQLTSGVVVTALTLNAGTNQSITRMPFVEPVGGVTAIPFGVGDWITCRYLNNGRWEVLPQRTGRYTDVFINGMQFGHGLNQATQSNTVGGYASGYTLSSGIANSFWGNQSGQLVSTGSRNSFFGSEAGMNTSTGSNNTAFGEETMRQGNGSARTSFGYGSCYNCTGSDVLAAGVNALFANTSGANNTGLGSGASQNNVTGSGNVSVGMNALFGVAANSHSNNTAVGLRAGTALTTGNGNIFIGDSAGYTQTTGIRNIIIGTNITASAVSANNEMNIGGLLFGTGMTATGTSTAGNFGIAVPAPTARLMLPAGTASANTSPLKFTSGTNLTSPENGAVEYDGTNYFVTSGGTRYTLSKTLTNTATLDFPSTGPGAVSDLTITITSAALGDNVEIGVPNGSVTTDGTYFGWVSASNTVTIRFANNSGVTTYDPASGTFRASVTKY